MEHNTRKGGARLVEACTLPLTAETCVMRVYTDLAVVDVTPQGFLVREILEGMEQGELQARSARTAGLRARLPPALGAGAGRRRMKGRGMSFIEVNGVAFATSSPARANERSC